MIKNAKMNDFDGFVTEDECTKLLKKSILFRKFWIKIDYTIAIIPQLTSTKCENNYTNTHLGLKCLVVAKNVIKFANNS